MQRLLPPSLVLLLTALAAAATFAGPDLAFDGLLGSPWRWLGAPVVAAGLSVTVAGSRRFAAIGTNIKTFDDPDVLVADGIFAISRNPMYLGFTAALLGVAMMLDSTLAWAAPLLFYLAADRWYIPFEEERMGEQFGAAYEAYQTRVSRWIGHR